MNTFNQKHVEQIMKDMDGIPFGNSAFQIEKFVADEYTPERMYRKVLLQLQTKIQALQETQIKRKKLDVDVRELVEKKKTSKGFELERIDIDLEEKTQNIAYEDKLIKDALAEISTYYNIYEKLPKFTKEQFELAESAYWKERLQTEARLEIQATGSVEKGTQDTLRKLGVGLARNPNGGVSFVESPLPKLLTPTP